MNPQQRILAAGLFVVAWGTNVSTPLILRYQDRLALSDTGAVGIFTVYVGGILLSLLFAGRLSDKLGRKPLVLPFVLSSAVASLVLIVGRNSLPWLFTGRFMLGLASGAVLSVGTAWLTELSSAPDEANHGELAAKLTTLIYLGFGFGPLTSALYDRIGPYPLVVPYLIHVVASIIVLAGLMTVRETKASDPTVSLRPQLGVPAQHRGDFLKTLAPSAVWVFGFPSVGFALFPLILRDAVGGSNDVLVAGFTGTLTALAVLLSGRITRRANSARQALRYALSVGILGYVLGSVAFVSDLWQLIPFAAICLGSASGTLLNAGLSITEEMADQTNRGALNATFYLCAYAGMAMPVFITLIARISNLRISLSLVTVVAVAVAIYLTSTESSATTSGNGAE